MGVLLERGLEVPNEIIEQYRFAAKPNVNMRDVALVPILLLQEEQRLPDGFEDFLHVSAVNSCRNYRNT